MVVKTFRGVILHGGQNRIRLQTIKGKVGYRIVKFQVIQLEPGQVNVELTMKIYRHQQTTINNTVNFSDSDLLAVNYYQSEKPRVEIIFDNEIFNQDIYLTLDDISGEDDAGNYYLELEVIPLDDSGAEYTTLKDMRST